MKKTFGYKYNNIIAYFINFLSSTLFFLPIWSFFFTDYAGITLDKATLLISLSTITTMIFEVPSGTWADRYGRKKTLIYGTIIVAILRSTYLRNTNIVVFIIAIPLSGIGRAMISGNIRSLIYDRYSEKNQKDKYDIFVRNFSIVRFVSRAIGVLIGGWMYTINPTLPYTGMFIFSIIKIIVIFFLYESQYHKKITTKASTWSYMKKGRQYLFSHKQLTTFLPFMIIGSVIAETIWSLYQPILQSEGFSIIHISYIYVPICLLSAVGSYISKYIYKGGYPNKIMNISIGLQLIALGCFFFLPGRWKTIGIIFLQIRFGIYSPIISSFINHKIPSSHRATINSIENLMYQGGVFVFIGASGRLWLNLGAEKTYGLLILLTLVIRASYNMNKRKNERL